MELKLHAGAEIQRFKLDGRSVSGLRFGQDVT